MHVNADIPERCHLEHRLFATLGDVAFRRSDADGLPVMSVNLGEREASIPLRSVRHEFSIGEDTPDGRMLELIGTALDYVACLQPGDKLPLELRTGQASWEPAVEHTRIAGTKLRLQLVNWHAPHGRWGKRDATEAELLRLAGDPAFHEAVCAVSHRAAAVLGLEQARQVIALIEDLSGELSYIEALRERLLVRVEAAGRRCAALNPQARGSLGLAEMVGQVVRLITIARRQIRSRFEDLDAQTGEIISALRNVESQRCFIRANRDWLYRSQRAWDPLLKQWDDAPPGLDDGTAALFGRTYKFLAPRFMPTTEWQIAGRAKRRRSRRMTW